MLHLANVPLTKLDISVPADHNAVRIDGTMQYFQLLVDVLNAFENLEYLISKGYTLIGLLDLPLDKLLPFDTEPIGHTALIEPQPVRHQCTRR